VTSPDVLIDTIAEAVAVLRGSLPGPAFIEIPHDFFHAPVSVSADFSKAVPQNVNTLALPATEIESAHRQIAGSRTHAILLGAGVRPGQHSYPPVCRTPALSSLYHHQR